MCSILVLLIIIYIIVFNIAPQKYYAYVTVVVYLPLPLTLPTDKPTYLQRVIGKNTYAFMWVLCCLKDCTYNHFQYYAKAGVQVQ